MCRIRQSHGPYRAAPGSQVTGASQRVGSVVAAAGPHGELAGALLSLLTPLRASRAHWKLAKKGASWTRRAGRRQVQRPRLLSGGHGGGRRPGDGPGACAELRTYLVGVAHADSDAVADPAG